MIGHERIPLAAALALALAGSLAVGLQAPAQNQTAQAAHARELLRKARLAIGGEMGLSQVRSFSASGKLRRFVKYVSVQSPTKVVEKQKTLSDKFEFDFLLPDKFRKRASVSTLTGYGYSYTVALNGPEAWRDPPFRVQSSQSDRRVVDVSDIDRTRQMQTQDAQQQIAFFTLAWLLTAPPSFPLELSYEGLVNLDGRIVEAVMVQGPKDFRLALLLDQKTYLPVAFVASSFELRRETVLIEAVSLTRRHFQDVRARAQQERRARAKPPQQYEIRWIFSDHRPIQGVLLPHRITTSFNGEITEELRISEFEINHPINPKKFEGRAEAKR
jgi:hypothetical protein